MPVFCVTGASGYIGAETTRTLLADGHTVRGTVRDASDPSRYRYLTHLPGADERLTLHSADLLEQGSFDEAVRGCDHVLHTASPYTLTVEDPQRDLVAPAVDGTRSVLRSCLGVEGLRRVVVTSSLAAITDHGREGHVFSEDDWNQESSLDRNPYYYSKVRAERAAWDLVAAEEPDWDLVVVNPSAVIGPSLSPRLNESNRGIAGLADGHQPAITAIEFAFVDVRDVARAHVLAATEEEASGRFLVAAESWSVAEVAEVLRVAYPDHRVPRLRLDNALGTWLLRTVGWRTLPPGDGDFVRTNVGRPLRVDNSRSREVLGLSYRPVEASILDAVDDMIAAGHVTRAGPPVRTTT